MRYRITGANRDTGEDVELAVEARTQEDACEMANRRGILVSRCTSSPSPSGQPRPSPATTGLSPILKGELVSAGIPDGGEGETVGGGGANQKLRTRRPLLRMLVMLVAVAAATITIIYFAVLRPQHEQIQQTLRDTIDQSVKTKAMGGELAEQQLAEVQKQLRQVSVRDQGENHVQPAEPVAAVRDTQAKVRLRRYVQSCEGFVRQAKALRARVNAGVTYPEYNQKLQELIDEYAQIGSPPAEGDTAGFINAGVIAVEQYQNAGKRWYFALRNKLYLAEKDQIQNMFKIANGEVGTLVTEFERLQTDAE